VRFAAAPDELAYLRAALKLTDTEAHQVAHLNAVAFRAEQGSWMSPEHCRACLDPAARLHVVGLSAPLPLFDEPGTSSSVPRTPSGVHERSSAARIDVAIADS
jgi:hypothetical protein